MKFLKDLFLNLFSLSSILLHSVISFQNLLQIIISVLIIPNFTCLSTADFSSNIANLEDTVVSISDWMSANFLSHNPAKTEFILIGQPRPLAKLDHPTISLPDNVTLSPAMSAQNLGVIFDSKLSFTERISAISKPCLDHIGDLKHLRSTIDQPTARIIATALSHSKLDYCNSLILNLSASHLNRPQLVLNSAARAVTEPLNFDTFLQFLKTFIDLKSMRVLNTKSYL
jgi:hypothetical protein